MRNSLSASVRYLWYFAQLGNAPQTGGCISPPIPKKHDEVKQPQEGVRRFKQLEDVPCLPSFI